MCIIDIEEAKDEKYRRTVNAFVREIGIRHSLQGYYDIQEAICFGLECQEDIVPKMRTIYEAIALKHNVGYQCVERNIRHAINDAYMIDPKKLTHLFHYKINKPYANEVILLGIDLIRSGNFSYNF